MRMTSALANKTLKKLTDDKNYWISKEKEGRTYVAAVDEEPVIPEYNYSEVAQNITEIDKKIVKIKHAINVTNCINEVDVNGEKMTIDSILIKMAQLNKRRATLDTMRKLQPKTRLNSGTLITRKTSPEYEYINYDLELVKKEYESIDAEVTAMQIALDRYNQMVEFDVDI